MSAGRTRPQVVILMIGSESVGKTAMARRYKYDTFTANCTKTLCIDFLVINNEDVNWRIWDTAGDRRSTLRHFQGIAAVFICYDITREDTFADIPEWFERAQEVRSSSRIIFLIGTKSALQEERRVSTEDGVAMAARYDAHFIEVSAASGENVSELFEQLFDSLYPNCGKKVTAPRRCSIF